MGIGILLNILTMDDNSESLDNTTDQLVTGGSFVDQIKEEELDTAYDDVMYDFSQPNIKIENDLDHLMDCPPPRVIYTNNEYDSAAIKNEDDVDIILKSPKKALNTARTKHEYCIMQSNENSGNNNEIRKESPSETSYEEFRQQRQVKVKKLPLSSSVANYDIAIKEEGNDITVCKNDEAVNVVEAENAIRSSNHVCSVCGKSYDRLGILKLHMRCHKRRRRYCCAFCSQEFSSSSHLKSHVSVHDGSLRVPCSVCQKLLSCRQSLKRHMLMHTDKQSSSNVLCTCPICRKWFTAKHSLAVHMRSHTGERPYVCKACGKSFITKSHLSNHEEIHGNDKKLPCSICEKVYKNKDCLRSHMRSHAVKKKITCKLCGQCFGDPRQLKAHVIAHGDKRWIHQCQICGKTYSRHSSLTMHMRVHTGERPYKCDHCLKTFIKSSHLKEHMHRNHERQNVTYPCSLCAEEFPLRSALRVHRLRHKGEKRFQCDVCNKKFKSNAYLRTHLNFHRGIKAYKCDLCSKRFTFQSGLRIHKRVHAGDRTHCCQHCGQMFYLSTQLREHIRIHTGEKPFACSFCSLSFRTKFSCDIHMSSHTGAKSCICEICGKCFRALHLLNSHKLTHLAKTKPCPICQKRFARLTTLKQHLRGVHKQNMSIIEGEKQGLSKVQDTEEDKQIQSKVADTAPSPTPEMILLLLMQIKGFVETLDESNQTETSSPSFEKRDKSLLALSILNNFIKSSNQTVMDFIRQNGTAKFFFNLMAAGEQFVAHSVAQCLTAWLKHCRSKEEWKPMVELIVNSLVVADLSCNGLLNGFSVLNQVLVRQKPGEDSSEDLAISTDKREFVCDQLLLNSTSILDKYLDRDRSDHLVYSSLTVWSKLLGIYNPTPQSMSISVTVLQAVVDGKLSPVCYSKAVSVLTRSLPHSADLVRAASLPTHTVRFASSVMEHVGSQLLEFIPFVDGQEVFGCKLYSRHDMAAHSGGGYVPSSAACRKLIILMLRASVVLVQSHWQDRADSLIQPLKTLLMVRQKLHPGKGQSEALPYTSLMWLFEPCGDQDDILIEALLSLIIIVELLNKSCTQHEVIHEICSMFEPHLVFILFLSMHAAWDESMLLDLLTSPETCFLTYLVKYLRYMLLDWDRFLIACKHFQATHQSLEGHLEDERGSDNSMTCLERVMTLLIRLHMKVDRAQGKNLIGYNCKPLMKLFEQCEERYETPS